MKLGSHNSSSFEFNYKVQLQWNRSHWKWISKLPKNFLNYYSKCQSKTFQEQFDAGVRHFDIRVSISKEGDFWTSHTFPCIPLEEVLNCFLSTKFNELCFLYIQSDWECSIAMKENWDRFIEFLASKNISLIQRKVKIVLAEGKSPNIWFNQPTASALLLKIQEWVQYSSSLDTKYVFLGLYCTPSSLFTKSVETLAKEVEKFEPWVQTLPIQGYFKDFI